MKIEVLGTGCYNCLRLESLIDEVLLSLGMSDVEVLRISDERIITQYLTLEEIPGLVINGQLANTREVPTREMLRKWLIQSAQLEESPPA